MGVRIENLKLSNGAEVDFSVERGGIVTSLKLGKREIMYMDQETFDDASKNVRGGFPVLFPNAGAIAETPYKLKQHGFARTSSDWKLIEKSERGVVMELSSNPKTKEVFPFDFLLKTKVYPGTNGSVTVEQEAANTGKKDMPTSFGLHPYFSVKIEDKKNIKWDFTGGEIIAGEFDKWSNGGTTTIDNPGAPLNIAIPGIGRLVMNMSKEYERIWVWSLPNKDFVCIEPFMRDPGALIDNPVIVRPGEKVSARVIYQLEK